jgi:molecular chaperone DnaJ
LAPQPEWFEKDYYKTLGVAESASQKEITSAYRKLARELHPDANPGDSAAEERFKDVSAAYDVVGDEAKRKEYDEVRRLGPIGAMGGAGFPGAGGPAGAGGGFSFSADDLGDLFGNLFNTGTGPGARRRPRGAGPQRGADLQTELTMDFRDAVEGITTTLHLTSDVACSTCTGTGSAPGTAPQVCTNCHGRGVIDENQGMFSFSRPCSVCGGKGVIVVEPCPTCSGTGIVRRPRDVKVRIPAGIQDGKTMKLKGRGGPGRNGGPNGDLYVKVNVASDSVFGRSGDNLTLTVPVTFAEAALGTRLTVPTIDGAPVTLKLPAGTSSGKVFRIKGKGIDTGRKGHGDLLVTVEVTVPTRLSKEQRAAVEAFAAASHESPRAHLGV